MARGWRAARKVFRSRVGSISVALGLIAGVIALGAVVAPVEASAAPSDPVVTDYATYPLSHVPATCTSQGAAALVNPRFTVRGQQGTDLRVLAPGYGETVVMNWDGFAAGCEGIGVGLSLKVTTTVGFDPLDKQYGVSQNYCGPGGQPCAQPFELSMVVDLALLRSKCFQLDAHLGPQLSIVGPGGGYYHFNNSVFDMLISAYNTGAEPCTYEVCEIDPKLLLAGLGCVRAAQRLSLRQAD